jgi:hypothetical protein
MCYGESMILGSSTASLATSQLSRKLSSQLAHFLQLLAGFSQASRTLRTLRSFLAGFLHVHANYHACDKSRPGHAYHLSFLQTGQESAPLKRWRSSVIPANMHNGYYGHMLDTCHDSPFVIFLVSTNFLFFCYKYYCIDHGTLLEPTWCPITVVTTN